jgi:glycosyltransferase involved in cell wall biosynthesis
MRIAMVYNYLPTHLGGIEGVVDALALEFTRRGHEVCVLGADLPSHVVEGFSRPYRMIGVPAFNQLETRLGVPYPLHHPRLVTALARETARAEVVYAHGFLCLSTLAALGLSRVRGRAPVRVLVEHVGHVRYDSPWLERVEAAAIRSLGRATTALAEGVIVCSTRVREELGRLAPGRPVRWIPNGVDTSRHHPASPDERARLRRELGWDERPRVLFVGRLVAKKGIGVAFQAAVAGQGAFEVVVVGPGAPPAPPPPHVTLVGPVAPEKVVRYYQAADAFLLPSHGEGFPLTAQEALAAGLPVFLGEDPSYAAYQEGARRALQQVPLDGAVIAAQLLRLFQSPTARAEAAQDAVEYVVQRCSWSRVADEHEAFARQLRQGPSAALGGASSPATAPLRTGL